MQNANFYLNQLQQQFGKLLRYSITKECTTDMVTWTIELLSRLRLVNIRLHCIYKNYINMFQKIDVGAVNFAMNKARENAIDFTMLLINTELVMTTKESKSYPFFWTKPFDINLW